MSSSERQIVVLAVLLYAHAASATLAAARVGQPSACFMGRGHFRSD
jgi:hypothetical protein